MHQKVSHAGCERTLSESRCHYWIVHGRGLAKNIVWNCIVCRKLRQSAHITFMADLPPERFKPFSSPFTVTGVDLFGPFNLKFGRNKSTKAWGALFTCATVRAMHLEIVESPSSESFLQALKRFVSHHGWPTTIILDNRKSFVGAEKELKKLLVEVRKKWMILLCSTSCAGSSSRLSVLTRKESLVVRQHVFHRAHLRNRTTPEGAFSSFRV